MALTALHDDLERIGREGSSVRSYNYGRAAEACERADDAVFNALNVLAHFVDDATAKEAIRDDG